MARSSLEKVLAFQLQTFDIPFVAEYVFCPGRRWRFDFAWPEKRVALEVEGGVFIAGRHTRGAGFEADCEKMNAAALLGWRVLRVTRKHIEEGIALALVQRILKGEEK